MEKKNIIGIGLCIMLLISLSLAGCTGPDNGEVEDSTIKAIKDAGKLTVGTSADYPPMESIDGTGDIIGFDVDLVQAVADELGVDLEMVDLGWNNLITFEALNNGEVDMLISAITITSDRSEQVLFSRPYLNAGQVIIVNATNEDVILPEDLLEKTVGVQINTTSGEEAEKYVNGTSQVVNYTDYEVAKADLIAGSIDAIIIDYPAGVGLAKGSSDIKIVGDPFTDELYGVAIKLDETALKEIVDTVITSGVIADLEADWF